MLEETLEIHLVEDMLPLFGRRSFRHPFVRRKIRNPFGRRNFRNRFCRKRVAVSW